MLNIKTKQCIQLLLVSVMLIFLHCGGLKGEFAFKNAFDDAFRKTERTPEFHVDEEIQWVFSFKTPYSYANISVLIQQLDLSLWIEVAAYSDYIGEEKSIVKGTIQNYPPGKYRITLMDTFRNKLISETEFIVYSEEEED